MPASLRQVTRADLLSDAEFAKVRKERRAALLPVKRLRRLELGPSCTVYFECFDTMLFQVQEMLLTEGGGEAQIEDELQAYNPLIPQGSELVATVMFEIDDPVRRANLLARLGGVENDFFLQIGDERAQGAPEGDIERTREDGKASSVLFMRFPFTPKQIADFKGGAGDVVVGFDHPNYGHMAVMPPAVREALSRDFD